MFYAYLTRAGISQGVISTTDIDRGGNTLEEAVAREQQQTEMTRMNLLKIEG